MIITISDMWKNQQKMLDNDNQIKLSSLIGFLDHLIEVLAEVEAEVEPPAQDVGGDGGGSS